MAKASEAYSTKERAELLLLNLQKLRAEVSAIEAHYDVLEADYTKICDDAMLKISSMKTDLADALESKIGELEVFKSEMSGLETRLDSWLAPAETRLQPKEVLNEDIAPAPRGAQCIIDKAADCIEFGLDKIGDGIIFPAEKNSHCVQCDIQERKLESEKAKTYLVCGVRPVPVPFLRAVCNKKGGILVCERYPAFNGSGTQSFSSYYPDNLGPQYWAYALSQRLAIRDTYLTEQICPN